MENNRRQILDMLAEGKIQVEEAERLLSLVSADSDSPQTGSQEKTSQTSGKYLRVCVEPEEGSEEEQPERVNIRVPMALIRAGVKLAAIIPDSSADSVNKELQKKGIKLDLASLQPEELIDALQDLQVDVEDGHRKVRVFVE